MKPMTCLAQSPLNRGINSPEHISATKPQMVHNHMGLLWIRTKPTCTQWETWMLVFEGQCTYCSSTIFGTQKKGDT